MFRLTVNGVYRAHFDTLEDALVAVEKQARPFQHSWKIEDGFRRTVAQS